MSIVTGERLSRKFKKKMKKKFLTYESSSHRSLNDMRLGWLKSSNGHERVVKGPSDGKNFGKRIIDINKSYRIVLLKQK